MNREIITMRNVTIIQNFNGVFVYRGGVVVEHIPANEVPRDAVALRQRLMIKWSSPRYMTRQDSEPPQAPMRITAKTITKAVIEHFNISHDVLMKPHRRQHDIHAIRALAWLATRYLTPASTTAIGSAWGRDHSTIVAQTKRITKRLEKSKALRDTFDGLICHIFHTSSGEQR